MRTLLIATWLVLGFGSIPACAQDKVAEGEYQMRWVSDKGTPEAKTVTRWVLRSKDSGGYHLDSEIQTKGDAPRVVQSEELDQQMIPTAIAYDVYQKDQKRPVDTIRCEFAGDSITCSGRSEKDGVVAPSKPFKHSGPFWLWAAGLFTLDLQWLMDGAVNMARLEKGKASITTITVDGGGKNAAWNFSDEEEVPLEFIGTENIRLNRVSVAAKHYILDRNEPQNLWIAAGILVKASGAEPHDEFVLVNYKQYKKLIPELPVEVQPAGPAPQKPK